MEGTEPHSVAGIRDSPSDQLPRLPLLWLSVVITIYQSTSFTYRHSGGKAATLAHASTGVASW